VPRKPKPTPPAEPTRKAVRIAIEELSLDPRNARKHGRGYDEHS
jgi:hypothetical protein